MTNFMNVAACKIAQQGLVTMDAPYIEEGWEPHLSIQPLLIASCAWFCPNCMFPRGLIWKLEYIGWGRLGKGASSVQP